MLKIAAMLFVYEYSKPKLEKNPEYRKNMSNIFFKTWDPVKDITGSVISNKSLNLILVFFFPSMKKYVLSISPAADVGRREESIPLINF